MHDGNGFENHNAEGETILEFSMCFGLVAVNTFFMKEMQKLVTYELGEVRAIVVCVS